MKRDVSNYITLEGCMEQLNNLIKSGYPKKNKWERIQIEIFEENDIELHIMYKGEL